MFVSARALPKEEANIEYGDNIKRAYTYKALNRLIQSSAADQTKEAMAKIHEETGKIPLLQIHDELAFSVASEKEARDLCTIMEDAVKLEVPSPSDISMGGNWGNLATLDIDH